MYRLTVNAPPCSGSLWSRKPFKNCIPIYDLRIAAGSFGEFQVPDPDAVVWVQPPEGIKASVDLFIAKVVGESMNKIIPNGAWCLFRANPAGSRRSRIVLASRTKLVVEPAYSFILSPLPAELFPRGSSPRFLP